MNTPCGRRQRERRSSLRISSKRGPAIPFSFGNSRSLEMSRSRVLSFTDPFAYQSAFRSVEVELFPTAKGKFYAELTQVSMNKLWIHCAHEDLPRIYVGVVKPHRTAIGFLTRPNQSPMMHCGMAV